MHMYAHWTGHVNTCSYLMHLRDFVCLLELDFSLIFIQFVIYATRPIYLKQIFIFVRAALTTLMLCTCCRIKATVLGQVSKLLKT